MILIDTNVTPSTPSTSGVVTVSMYSTKHWDITSATGERNSQSISIVSPGRSP